MSQGRRSSTAPKGAETTFERAAVLHQLGQLKEAERLFEAALEADAQHFDATYRLGIVRIQQSRFLEAAALFERAVSLRKRSAEAHHHLGVALTGQGRTIDAIACYERALSLKPGYAEAHNNLGHALQLEGLHERAMRHYRKALQLRPDYPEALNNLGNAQQALQAIDKAVVSYERALQLRPNYPEAHNNLASALDALGRHEEAIIECERALAVRPNYVEAEINLANALLALDRAEDAVARYENAIRIDADNAEAHSRLGQTLLVLGRTELAVAHGEKAVALRPDNVEALNRLGSALRAAGRIDEAIIQFNRAIGLAPRRTTAFYNLVTSRRVDVTEPLLAAMQALDADSLDAPNRIGLYFALGKAFADIGDHARSFDYISAVNRLKRVDIKYDEAESLARFTRVRETFTARLFGEKKGLGNPADLPVFIVGLPRSGTTLVEQIVASHPKVFGAGELRTMSKLANSLSSPDGTTFPGSVPSLDGERLSALGQIYLEAVRPLAPSSAERITDKMPGNFMMAGLISLVLPNARIIHVRRDPRDVALSCFSLLFAVGQDFTYDLGELGRYIRAYQDLMRHWHQVLPAATMLDVDYETITQNLDGEARRIVAHCGLEWNDACLDFHRTSRPVRTASAVQVRQPIYTSSVGRWRQYADRLKPLFDVLETSAHDGD